MYVNKCLYFFSSSSNVDSPVTASALYRNLEEITDNGRSSENQMECCICLERQSDMSLPCAHNYCEICIDKWLVMIAIRF